MLFSDDFSDPGGVCGTATTALPNCWGIDTDTNTSWSVGYVGGTLRFDTVGSGAWVWSRRVLTESWPLMQVEGVVVPSAAGIFGLLCGTTGDELVGAVVSTAGGWMFISIDANGVSVLSSDPNAGLAVPIGLATEIGLACLGTDAGGLQLQLELAGAGVVATFTGDEGPGSFDRVGAYAEALVDGYSASLDNVNAFGGTGAGAMSLAAQMLLLHVPEAWRANCQETPPPTFEAGALASLSCSPDGVGADIADYVQFDSQASMDAAYQTRVTYFSVAATGSCSTGPNEGSYTIGSESVGRVLCAPQTAGIRFDWTDDQLNILTTLTDFDGSYAETFESWQQAGPNR